METLTLRLKTEVDKLKKDGISDSSILNHLKEYLQITLLNYIYNSTKYSDLVMYGGSVLRICHNLPRMSEDLDFQTNRNLDIDKLSDDIKKYFKNDFGFDVEIYERGNPQRTSTLTLKFPIVKNLGLSDVRYEKINLRVDINFFEGTDLFEKEKIPIVKGNFSFLINTYTLPTLMASKIVAILKRDKRNVNGQESSSKPRDIYDLLWYLEKQVIPNLEYVNELMKPKEYKNVLELFDDINLRVANLSDNVFESDLASFFYYPVEFQSWFKNWRERFLSLMDTYSILEVKDLIKIRKYVEFFSDNVTYSFVFSTTGGKKVVFNFVLSDYWFEYKDKQIGTGYRIKKIEDKVEKAEEFKDLDFEYVGLFYKKILEYLERNDNIVTKDIFRSRLIRTTANNLDITTQIVLNKRTLERIKLEDLLL